MASVDIKTLFYYKDLHQCTVPEYEAVRYSERIDLMHAYAHVHMHIYACAHLCMCTKLKNLQSKKLFQFHLIRLNYVYTPLK